MAKVTDYKTYAKDQLTKAGLEAAKLQQAEELLSDPAVLKALQDGFKPLPDYSFDMEQTRDRAKAEAIDRENDEWYQKTKRQYDYYTAETARLKALGVNPDGTKINDNGNGNGANGGTGVLSAEQIEAMLNKRLEALGANIGAREQAIMEYAELRERHAAEFKKPLDRAGFETAWKAHPEWGTSLSAAYAQYTEPDREATRTKAAEAAKKAAYEEGVRDGFSRRSVPADAKDKERFSPFFKQDKDVSKLSVAEQESASREAFFDGLREAREAEA